MSVTTVMLKKYAHLLMNVIICKHLQLLKSLKVTFVFEALNLHDSFACLENEHAATGSIYMYIYSSLERMRAFPSANYLATWGCYPPPPSPHVVPLTRVGFLRFTTES